MNAEEMIQQLLKQGKISEDDLAELRGPSEDEKIGASILHTLFCFTDHTVCTFYDEEESPTPWEGAEHLRWLGLLSNFVDLVGLHSAKEFYTAIEEYRTSNLSLAVKLLILAGALGIESISADHVDHLVSSVSVSDELYPEQPLEPSRQFAQSLLSSALVEDADILESESEYQEPF